MADKIHRNSLKPGFKLHWYRIETILGQGGFGITYLAHDFNLDRQVAIKEYLPIELAVRERDSSVHPVTEGHGEKFQWGLERFLSEARTLARFRHPNIVLVLNVFEGNNTAYMVMGYEQGESLQDIVTRQKFMEEAELINILFPVFGGLQQVHEAGFIHRDIKPANIYVRGDGSPVLLDFGSARQALGVATQTLTTLVSPGYAPFEQYYSKSDQQGPWTDIYGLGATLYRAVVGVPPIDAVDRSRMILKGGRDTFVSALEAGRGRYSERFLLAIDHALQFKEEDRPQTIAEWRQEFAVSDNVATASGPTVRAAVRPSDRPATIRIDGNTETARKTAMGVAHGVAAPLPPSRGRVALVALVAAAVLLLGAGWLMKERFERRDAEARAAALQQLLDEAAGDLAAGRITEPSRTNALARYREALRLDPGNEEAEGGLRTVAVKLVDSARAATAGSRFEEAEQQLGQAAAVWPDASGLQAARESLDAHRAEQRQREERMESALADARMAVASGDVERARQAMRRANEAGADPAKVGDLRASLQQALMSQADAAAREARRSVEAKNPANARAALKRARDLKSQADNLGQQE